MSNLQIGYNVFSAIYIFYLLFKVQKMNKTVDFLGQSGFLTTMSSFILIKVLKEKGMITEQELDVAFKKHMNEQQS